MCHSRQVRILWDTVEQVACLGKQGTPGLNSSGDEEQRLQVWPASGHYGQKLWKTETHKHEQDRPDGGHTDKLIYREEERKNTEAC